jgi:predicted transcriptional regulator
MLVNKHQHDYNYFNSYSKIAQNWQEFTSKAMQKLLISLRYLEETNIYSPDLLGAIDIGYLRSKEQTSQIPLP